MAANVESVALSAHNTIDAATVDIITLTSYGAVIQVVHRDATSTDPFYVTFGGTAAAAATPTVAGDGTFVVMPGATVNFPWPVNAVNQAVVKLICAGAEPYSVQVIAARGF